MSNVMLWDAIIAWLIALAGLSIFVLGLVVLVLEWRGSPNKQEEQ